MVDPTWGPSQTDTEGQQAVCYEVYPIRDSLGHVDQLLVQAVNDRNQPLFSHTVTAHDASTLWGGLQMVCHVIRRHLGGSL